MNLSALGLPQIEVPQFDLPQIDLSALPDFHQAVGLFGSLLHAAPNDSLVILMTYLFETMPPPPGG